MNMNEYENDNELNSAISTEVEMSIARVTEAVIADYDHEQSKRWEHRADPTDRISHADWEALSPNQQATYRVAAITRKLPYTPARACVNEGLAITRRPHSWNQEPPGYVRHDYVNRKRCTHRISDTRWEGLTEAQKLNYTKVDNGKWAGNPVPWKPPTLSPEFWTIRERFVLACGDPEAAADWAILVKKERWEAAEDLISTNSTAALRYAEFLGQRLTSAEPTILQDAFVASRYAAKVIGEAWPEAEGMIATDAKAAQMYATFCLKGEFELGEDMIATDASASLHYARDALRSEFKQGEQVLAQQTNKHLREPYLKHLERKGCDTSRFKRIVKESDDHHSGGDGLDLVPGE